MRGMIAHGMAEFAALWSFRTSTAGGRMYPIAPYESHATMPTQDIHPVRLPSLERFRALTSPPGARPFRVGILIGPKKNPQKKKKEQGVLGLMSGAEIHLLWK